MKYINQRTIVSAIVIYLRKREPLRRTERMLRRLTRLSAFNNGLAIYDRLQTFFICEWANEFLQGAKIKQLPCINMSRQEMIFLTHVHFVGHIVLITALTLHENNVELFFVKRLKVIMHQLVKYYFSNACR